MAGQLVGRGDTVEAGADERVIGVVVDLLAENVDLQVLDSARLWTYSCGVSERHAVRSSSDETYGVPARPCAAGRGRAHVLAAGALARLSWRGGAERIQSGALSVARVARVTPHCRITGSPTSKKSNGKPIRRPRLVRSGNST